MYLDGEIIPPPVKPPPPLTKTFLQELGAKLDKTPLTKQGAAQLRLLLKTEYESKQKEA